MKERSLLKKVCRYHRISYNKRLEALISLYKDTIYIKIDTVYDDLTPRVTYYETYLTFQVHYDELVEDLEFNNASEKLAKKVKVVLEQWKSEGLFSFDEVGIISINGGQSNDNQ